MGDPNRRLTAPNTTRADNREIRVPSRARSALSRSQIRALIRVPIRARSGRWPKPAGLARGPAVVPDRPRPRPRTGTRTTMHGYPRGVSRFLCAGALLGRRSRCYPSRAPDAGTLAGTFGAPRRSRWSDQAGPAQRRPWRAYTWLRRRLISRPPRRQKRSAGAAIQSSELQGHDRAYGREARLASRSR